MYLYCYTDPENDYFMIAENSTCTESLNEIITEYQTCAFAAARLRKQIDKMVGRSPLDPYGCYVDLRDTSYHNGKVFFNDNSNGKTRTRTRSICRRGKHQIYISTYFLLIFLHSWIDVF